MRIADLLKVKQPEIYRLLANQYGVKVDFSESEGKTITLIGDDYLVMEYNENVKRIMEERKGVDL